MLSQVGWLNVEQMLNYHSLVLIFKAKHHKKPSYLYNQILSDINMNTRLAATNGIDNQRRTQE